MKALNTKLEPVKDDVIATVRAVGVMETMNRYDIRDYAAFRRWQKCRKGTPSYEQGYRWFDCKTMTHYVKRPKNTIAQLLTKYSPIKHSM